LRKKINPLATVLENDWARTGQRKKAASQAAKNKLNSNSCSYFCHKSVAQALSNTSKLWRLNRQGKAGVFQIRLF